MENIFVNDGNVSFTLMVKDGLVCQVLVTDNHSQELIDKFCNIKKIRIKRGQDLLEIEPVPLDEFMESMNLNTGATIENNVHADSWSNDLQKAASSVDSACECWTTLDLAQKQMLEDAANILRESLHRFDRCSKI